MKKTSLQLLLQGIGTVGFDAEVEHVITDSRSLVEGCVFVATRGERVDSHIFVQEAIEKGAVLAVVDHFVEGVPQTKQLVVQNTLAALIAIGGNYRNQFNPVIVAVTGSVGKTTTKEFIYAALSKFGKTLKNEGNKNSEYGMTETLLNLDETYNYAVVEMGMSAQGDIAMLSKAAKPQAAVLTNIGIAHIERLGTQENILNTKLEITEGLPMGGTLVLNKDDALLKTATINADVKKVWYALEDDTADVTATNIQTVEDGQTFTIVDKQFHELPVHIPTLGKHTVYDALAAYTLVSRMGLSAQQVAEGLADYETAGQRQKISDFHGITIIEDCYNANPDSMRAALTTLEELPNHGKKIAILGDMLELGEFSQTLHEEVGTLAAEKEMDIVYTFGSAAQFIAEKAAMGKTASKHFATKEALANALKEIAFAGDAILFKASRGMQFEEIINLFLEKE